MQQPIPIIPQYKLLLSYDVKPNLSESYYRYVLGEFVPTLQEMGLYLYMAWHTAYGDYPARHLELVAENWPTINAILRHKRFQQMEAQLKEYTENYSRKLVRYRDNFQF